MLSALIRILTALRSLVAPAIFSIEIDGDDVQVRSGEVPGAMVRGVRRGCARL